MKARAHRLPPVERVCKERGCDTALCRYNPTPKCARHGGWVQEATAREQREAMVDLTVRAR